jgi:hypothetical protein
MVFLYLMDIGQQHNQQDRLAKNVNMDSQFHFLKHC